MAENTEQIEESGSRSRDPELLIMGRVMRLLDDLADDAARGRVVAYISSRYPDRRDPLRDSNERG